MPDDSRIPRECAKQFQQITNHLATLPDLHAKVDKLSIAVCGNGNPERSLLARVKVIEDRATHIKTRSGKWKDRAYGFVASLVLMLIGVLISALSGCAYVKTIERSSTTTDIRTGNDMVRTITDTGSDKDAITFFGKGTP